MSFTSEDLDGAKRASTTRNGNTDHVEILLGVYNGSKHLADQLVSIKNQTFRDWSLHIGDDGSSDRSKTILRKFARAEPQREIRISDGPQKGFAMNFLSLLNGLESENSYVCFCDQDDVWLREKLRRAIDKLKSVPAKKPAIYCGRTWVCSSTLRKQSKSPWFSKGPSFKNAIVQSIGGGNTMMLNPAAVKLVKRASRDVDLVVSHDWWIYQLVSSMGGEVLYDDQPMILYRQHEHNVIGADNGFGATLARLRLLINGTYKDWNSTNIRALECCRHMMTIESQYLLDTFHRIRGENFFRRFRLMWKSGITHQTLLGNMGLWLAIAINRI